MKLNLKTPIKTLDGKTITNEDKVDVTIKNILSQALLAGGTEEKDSKKKYDRYVLLTDINKNEKEIELTSEQISDLKTLINECYPILVYGQSVDILEGKSHL